MTLPACIDRQKDLLVRKFNQRSRDGIADIKNICVNNNLDLEQSIVQFFLETNKKINLTAVGNYLAGMESNSEKILTKFIESIDFSKMSFADGLRRYFNTFHLPGEAYKIDKLMKKFSEYYLQSNSNSIIQDPEAAYNLTLQALMLHAEPKTSLIDLQSNLKGINQNMDFDKSFLKAFHSSIVNRPFELTVIKNIPGYIIESAALPSDEFCNAVTQHANKNNIDDLGKLFTAVKEHNITIKIHPINKLLRRLTSVISIITFHNSQEQCLAVMELSNPTSLSKLLFGINPRIIVQGVYYEGDEKINSESLYLAAELAATFPVKVTSVNATFFYDNYDLLELYRMIMRNQLNSH